MVLGVLQKVCWQLGSSAKASKQTDGEIGKQSTRAKTRELGDNGDVLQAVLLRILWSYSGTRACVDVRIMVKASVHANSGPIGKRTLKSIHDTNKEPKCLLTRVALSYTNGWAAEFTDPPANPLSAYAGSYDRLDT